MLSFKVPRNTSQMGGTSGTDTTEMQNIFNILALYSVLLPYYLPM